MRKSELVRENATLVERLRAAEAELGQAKLVGTVASAAQVEVDRLEASGDVTAEALVLATRRVVDSERGRLANSEADKIERDRYDEIVEELRRTELPAIREEILARYKSDGTFTRLERDARFQVEDQVKSGVIEELRSEATEAANDPTKRGEIRSELKAEISDSDDIKDYRERVAQDVRFEEEDAVRQEIRDEIRTELESDESRAAVREEVRKTLLEDDFDLRDYRDRLVQARRDELRGQVNDELREDIQRQVEANEPEIRARLRQEILDGPSIADYRQRAAAQFESDVREMTLDEVREAVKDEELNRLLKDRADAEKEELRREKIARELNDQFTRGEGIDMTAIEEGTSVEIYIGETVGKFEFTEKVGTGNAAQNRKVEKPTAFYNRKLTLASLGNGMYVVNGDTYFGSANRAERYMAEISGTRLAIGRQKKEANVVSLEPALFADVPLWYDKDTSDDRIKSALYPVLDVVINGVSARGVEHVDAKTVDQELLKK